MTRNLKDSKVAHHLRILQEHLPMLREEYGVGSLGIFGSYIRGEEGVDSDLDILVEFTVVPDLFQFVAFQRFLAELLGVQIDLVMKNALKPRIGQRILDEVVMV